MRLSAKLKNEILNSINRSFDNAPVYLFGSRIDDTKRGGDIDLAIKTEKDKDSFRLCRLKFLIYLEKKGIDYPFDVVQYNQETKPLLKAEIDNNGILLK